jgi:hypothetical protein
VGCNKPTQVIAEKAAEVVRNDKSGTCVGCGNPAPGFRPGEDAMVDVDGEAVFERTV